jgi:hypothetical protein
MPMNIAEIFKTNVPHPSAGILTIATGGIKANAITPRRAIHPATQQIWPAARVRSADSGANIVSVKWQTLPR